MVLPERTNSQHGGVFEYDKPLKIKNEKEAFDLVDLRHGQADHGRDPLTYAMHQIWYVSLRHYMNLREHSGDIGLLTQLSRQMLPHDSVYAANHLLPLVSKQIARLAGVAEKFDVSPKSTDPDDIFAARLGDALLEHENEIHNWTQTKAACAFWAVTCGPAIIETDWDAHMGKLMTSYQNPLDGRSMSESEVKEGGEDLMKMLQDHKGVKSKRSGETAMRVVAPFELTVPRGVSSLDQSPWIVLEREVSPEYIWERWPNKAKEIRMDDFSASTDTVLWKRLRREASRFGHSLGTSGAEASDVVTIKTLWIPPSGWCKSGYVIHALKDTLLSYDEHPYFKAGLDPREREFRHFRFPVSMAGYAPAVQRFWPMGLLEHTIGPQMQYNQSIDQIMRQRDRFGGPTWLARRDTELSARGDIWEYDQQQPTLVPPPPMGGSQIETAQIALSDMRNISSQTDAASDVPSGMRAGSGVTQILENDNMTMGPTLISLAGLYRDTQNRILGLNWKFAKTERLIGVYGEERQGDAIAFKGSQLNGNIFVRIDPTSMKLQSRAATMELLQMMGSVGALDPANPDHMESIHDALEFKRGQELFKGVRKQRRRARHEELLFMRLTGAEGGAQAPWPDVNDYDNHVEHIRSHQLFLSSDTFEMWPPIKKMAFMAHIRKHEQIIAEMLLAQQGMAAQPQAGGSPPAPVGEASQPRDAQGPAPTNQPQGSFA